MHYTAKGGFEFVEKCKHIEEEFYPTVLNYLCFHISHLRIIFTELNRLTFSSIIAQKFRLITQRRNLIRILSSLPCIHTSQQDALVVKRWTTWGSFRDETVLTN